MSIQAVITNAGFAAMAKGWAGIIGGVPIKNVCSYFVIGEGGANTASTSAVVATGNGSLVVFTVTLAHTPVVRGTLTVTMDDGNIFTDNGQGVLTATTFGCSGTINYKTGVMVLTFAAAPAIGDKATAAYTYRSTPKTPDPTLTQTEAQASPVSPSNTGHLAFYKKFFGSDASTTATYIALTNPHVDMRVFLDLAEFIDDGRGLSPACYELGIFDSEDQMIVYATFTKETKNGSTLFDHTATLTW